MMRVDEEDSVDSVVMGQDDEDEEDDDEKGR